MAQTGLSPAPCLFIPRMVTAASLLGHEGKASPCAEPAVHGEFLSMELLFVIPWDSSSALHAVLFKYDASTSHSPRPTGNTVLCVESA